MNGEEVNKQMTRPVGEWSDDQSRRVAEVLVWVFELRVTDIGETVLLLVVPAMSKLRQPRERLRVLDLLRDQLADDVAVVHLDGTDRHDLLSVARRQLADQQHDERVQLRYLRPTTSTTAF